MNRYKTFKTATGYCTVDTEATINNGDVDFYTFDTLNNNVLHIKSIHTINNVQYSFVTYEGTHSGVKNPKIIACHPPLEGVATYCELPKDDVEEMAEKAFWSNSDDTIASKDSFIKGYNQAKSEGCFTKEDIMAWYKHVKTHTVEEAFAHLATLSKQPDWQFQVEETFLNNANTDELKRSEFVPKIIINVLQGHWETIPPTPSKIG